MIRMIKRSLIVLTLLSVISIFLYIRFNKVEVKAPSDYPVHNLNTGLNYTTIQEAIDANETLDGHTIFVEAGVYYEHVVVNKSLSIFGEDKERTIIDGNWMGDAMYIQRSWVTISGFTVRHAADGIITSAILRLRGIVIDGNIISDIYNEGIAIYSFSNLWDTIGDQHMLKGNIIENTICGIELGGCVNITICQNELKNNTYGMSLVGGPKQPIEYQGSHNNLLFCNTITNSSIGIYLGGIGNKLYHNNFLDNLNQVYIHHVSHDNNWSMSYSEGGNYWSNYTGSDLNHDGIGDTPHVIDGNNTDYYPLMGMFSDFPVTHQEETYSITTICNSTISDLQFNGTAITFNVTGENGTAGFCRMCIPTALMSDYQVFVNDTEVSYNLFPPPISNSTHSYIYFTYYHSTQEVIIVPEFPTWASILLVFVILTVFTVTYKQRRFKTSLH